MIPLAFSVERELDAILEDVVEYFRKK